MIGYAVQAVLLAALIVTSLTVGFMYRELRRLRGYQSQYVQVFDRTSAAAGDIGAAVRGLHGEGQELLVALGERIDAARVLVERLERLTGDRPVAGPAPMVGKAPEAEDFGSYTPRDLAAAASAEAERLKAGRRTVAAMDAELLGPDILGVDQLEAELLGSGSGSRRTTGGSSEAARFTPPPLGPAHLDPGAAEPRRSFRMAPSVKTLKPFKDRFS